MPVELLGDKFTDPQAPGSTNVSSTEAALTLAETRLLAQGAQKDTKHHTGELTEVSQDVFIARMFSLLLEDAQKLVLVDYNFAHG